MRSPIPLMLASFGALALVFTPVAAKDPPTPEQRIRVLEKQVRQVQKVIFPKGQPAATALPDETPAATQDSVTAVAGRLDALERQMADLVRASEENGNRLSVIEADLARLRAESDAKFRALTNPAPAGDAPAGEIPVGDAADSSFDAAEPAVAVRDEPAPSQPLVSRPKVETPKPRPVSATTAAAASTPAATTDGAEAAYDAGFRLWEAGKHDQAIAALTKMARDYPSSRRVSWAHNLAGRAQLDKGAYRDAADTLLKNYRRDPQGERAQDSVFYLGQALTKLGQPAQACKAYAELEEVYGSNVRSQLRAMLPAAKRAAKCG